MESSRPPLAACLLAFALGLLVLCAVPFTAPDPAYVHMTGPRAIRNSHILYLAGCIVMSHDAYYSPRFESVNLKKSFTPRLVNYVLEEETDSRDTFALAGNPNMNYGLHADVQVLHDILAANSGKTLVYTTVPGALVLGIFDYEAFHARLILDEIDRDFPAATAHTARLRALLAEYAAAHRLNQAPDPAAHPFLARAFTAFRAARGQMGQWFDSIFGFETAVLNRFDKLGRSELVDMLQSHADAYGDPGLVNAPMTRFLTPDELFRTPLARDIYLEFLKLFAAMAREKNTTLVVQLMPVANITPRDALASYQPAFVQEIRSALAPFANVRLVDLGLATDTFTTGDVAEAPGPRRGIMYFITGKLMHARLFVKGLLDQGLVSGTTVRGDLRDFLGVRFPAVPPGKMIDPNLAPIAFGFFPFVDTPLTAYTAATCYWPFLRNLGVLYD